MTDPAPVYEIHQTDLRAPEPEVATLSDIEHLAKRYAMRRVELRHTLDVLDDEIRQAKRKHLPTIQLRVENAAKLRDRLIAYIQAHPEYFRKPKTLILHGVRLGYAKRPDALEWDDDAAVCQRIKKELPEQAAVLINQPPPKPVKKALFGLKDKLLLKLGIRKRDGEDEVIAKPTDSEIDKLVDKLLEQTDEVPR